MSPFQYIFNVFCQLSIFHITSITHSKSPFNTLLVTQQSPNSHPTVTQQSSLSHRLLNLRFNIHRQFLLYNGFSVIWKVYFKYPKYKFKNNTISVEMFKQSKYSFSFFAKVLSCLVAKFVKRRISPGKQISDSIFQTDIYRKRVV